MIAIQHKSMGYDGKTTIRLEPYIDNESDRLICATFEVIDINSDGAYQIVSTCDHNGNLNEFRLMLEIALTAILSPDRLGLSVTGVVSNTDSISFVYNKTEFVTVNFRGLSKDVPYAYGLFSAQSLGYRGILYCTCDEYNVQRSFSVVEPFDKIEA